MSSATENCQRWSRHTMPEFWDTILPLFPNFNLWKAIFRGVRKGGKEKEKRKKSGILSICVQFNHTASQVTGRTLSPCLNQKEKWAKSTKVHVLLWRVLTFPRVKSPINCSCNRENSIGRTLIHKHLSWHSETQLQVRNPTNPERSLGTKIMKIFSCIKSLIKMLVVSSCSADTAT